MYIGRRHTHTHTHSRAEMKENEWPPVEQFFASSIRSRRGIFPRALARFFFLTPLSKFRAAAIFLSLSRLCLCVYIVYIARGLLEVIGILKAYIRRAPSLKVHNGAAKAMVRELFCFCFNRCSARGFKSFSGLWGSVSCDAAVVYIVFFFLEASLARCFVDERWILFCPVLLSQNFAIIIYNFFFLSCNKGNSKLVRDVIMQVTFNGFLTTK